MKIIKHGNPKYNKPDRCFKCDNCGCVFEAEYGEYKTGSQYNETYRYCKCPECGKQANEVVMRD